MVVNNDISKKIIDYAKSKNCITKETQTSNYVGIWVNEKRRIAKVNNKSIDINGDILKFINIKHTVRPLRQNGQPNVCNIKIHYEDAEIKELFLIVDKSIELASKYLFQLIGKTLKQVQGDEEGKTK